MGPRSIDRGILGVYVGDYCDHGASMGPRSIDRGIATNSVKTVDVSNASMGPRSIDRGIGYNPASKPPMIKLQWGRDQLIAEFEPGGPEPRGYQRFNGAAIN